MKNKKVDFKFLMVSILSATWLCISCSHTRTQNSTEAMVDEGASSSNVAQAESTEEAGASESIAVAEASTDSVEQSVGLTNEQAELAATSPVEGDKPETKEFDLAGAKMADASAVTLDGSEAGFMNTQSTEESTASNGSSPFDSLPSVSAIPFEETKKTAPKMKSHRKPSSSKPATPEKRTDSPAPETVAALTIPVAPALAPENKMETQALKEALGEDDDSSMAMEQADKKPEQLASVEVGSFIQRYVLWIAIAMVGFFICAFFWFKRDRSKDTQTSGTDV